MKCIFCEKEIKGYDNNPEPVKSEGRCCDDCNVSIVIPARLQNLYALRRSKNDR